MKKEMKEFKITCLGCEEIRFIPYFEFKQKTKEEKNKGYFSDIFTTIGLSIACLPLGCCTGITSLGDTITGKNDRTPEEQKEKYFELSKVNVCKKCGSLAKKTEVITHNISEIDK